MTQYMVRGYRFNPATVPQEIIAKVAMKEMQEMRERIKRQDAAEAERARMVESNRNRLLAEKVRHLNATCRPGAIRRAVRSVGTAWAMIWAVLVIVKDAIRDFGLDHGLWVYEPIDD